MIGPEGEQERNDWFSGVCKITNREVPFAGNSRIIHEGPDQQIHYNSELVTLTLALLSKKSCVDENSGEGNAAAQNKFMHQTHFRYDPAQEGKVKFSTTLAV